MCYDSGIFYLAEHDELPGEFVIKDKSTQYKFLVGKYFYVQLVMSRVHVSFPGMGIGLVSVGLISSILAIVHWFFCIRRLFRDPEEEFDEDEVDTNF